MTIDCTCIVEVLEIIQGQTRKPIIQLFFEKTKEPFDFTGMDNAGNGDEIKALFVKTDGTLLEKLWTDGAGDIAILSEAGGKIQIQLSVADTDLLKTGEKQDFEIEIIKDTETFIEKFEQKLTVVERVGQ